MKPLVFDIDEAAALLKRHRRTVYRMIDRGELRSVTYGGRKSIPVAEINRLVSVVA